MRLVATVETPIARLKIILMKLSKYVIMVLLYLYLLKRTFCYI